jgi:hypothetical protein
MIAIGRTQVLALALVAVAAAGFVMLRQAPEPAGVAPAASNPQGGTAARPEPSVADVNLEALRGTPAELGESQRDPFRFRPRPAPAPPPAPPRAAAPVIAAPPVPTGPPPPPPIALRYIGLVDAPTQAGRVAMLSDGRGNVFYGKEGDIIEGRYRILRVGPDSAELAYLDGRGRQTIRLSGQ